jgi:DNA-binding transcriptional LysR family regulator
MELEHLRMFSAAVGKGSISEAASELETTPRRVDRGITSLERALDETLFDRAESTPTSAGLRVFERAKELLRMADLAVARARLAGLKQGGTLRIATPIGLPPELARVAPQIMQKALRAHSLEWILTEDPVAQLALGADVALQFATQPPEGAWVGAVLARAPLQAVASRGYLDKHGTPTALADLDGQHLATWTGDNQERNTWPLWAGGGTPVHATFACNDAHMLRVAAQAGQFIALVPDPVGMVFKTHDGLTRVLPKIIGRNVSLWYLFPETLRGETVLGDTTSVWRRMAERFRGLSN